ncbi:MAG: cupin domain-containing protein [Methanosarcinaceae archaeon]|nr:cupin domain-containing protein [Methanosarcinaceae archaeon]
MVDAEQKSGRSEFQERLVSREQMMERVARFADLKPLPVMQDASIPQHALDIIYSRKLLPVIGLEGGEETPISAQAPIRGPPGITMTHAVAAPGQGPDLHAHKQTYETFTVLQGRFEIRWGDSPDKVVELSAFDTISVPPGVYRAFRNIGDEEGILQVIISGGINDMNDIHMPRRVAKELKAASPELFERVRGGGVTFDDDVL